MHNVFLYAARDSESYRQVEKYLTQLPFNKKLIILPPGTHFSSSLCLQLRSNDIFILSAQEEEEIDELILLRDEYEYFRIILISNNNLQPYSNKHILLSPRFISYIDNNLYEVSEYISNLLKKVQEP